MFGTPNGTAVLQVQCPKAASDGVPACRQQQAGLRSLFAAWCRDDESYLQTNGSSRYQHDPEYGGTVSLSGWKDAKSDTPLVLQPLPPMPPDHPRVRELIGSEAAARYSLPWLQSHASMVHCKSNDMSCAARPVRELCMRGKGMPV